MNILITGGAGFIGSNLVSRFLADGHDVYVADSLITGSTEHVSQNRDNPHFHFFEVAIENPEFLEAFLHIKLDRIYNLACPTGPPNIKILGEEMTDACSIGLKNTLKLAKETGAKYVYTSSAEIYGKPLRYPQAEEDLGLVDPQGWRANYEEGKRFGETLVAMFVDKYDVNARTVRFFNAYGPGMSLSDTRVAPRFIRQALLNEDITVQGDGMQNRTMCYVDDSINGLITAMEKGEKRGIYNVGGATESTIIEFADLVIKLTGSNSKIIHVERPSHDSDKRIPDTTKIQSLGWAQTIELEEGTRRMIEDFRTRMITQNILPNSLLADYTQATTSL
jgi:nucleoside-diphosphate-sugar epimerase